MELTFATVLVRKGEMILGTVRRCEGENFKGIKGAVGEIPSREEQEGKDIMTESGLNLSTLQ
jgi:hypothetical protein